MNSGGIFSLIDEKKFKYDYQDDKYTYKIEKIFNYGNYLFVIFSKLFLDSKDNKGDSDFRNHLYLITIDKDGRKITPKDKLSNIDNNELNIFAKMINDKNANFQALDLGEGKYKNIVFLNDEGFVVTITELNDKNANIWARVYRKLRGDGNSIKLKTFSKNTNEFFTDDIIEIKENENDINQFLTIYYERNVVEGLSELGGPNFGRIATNNINKLENTTEENEELLNVLDEYRFLYNYEYYWDKDASSENYAKGLYYFNNFCFTRDINDNTIKGETNTKKLFPYYEKTYLGGLTFDNGRYKYKDSSTVTDNLLSVSIDDNYIQYESYFNNALVYNNIIKNNLITRNINNNILIDNPFKIKENNIDRINTNLKFLEYIDGNIITGLNNKNYFQNNIDFTNNLIIYFYENNKVNSDKYKLFKLNNPDLLSWFGSNISVYNFDNTNYDETDIVTNSKNMLYRIGIFDYNLNSNKNIFIIDNRLDDDIKNKLLEFYTDNNSLFSDCLYFNKESLETNIEEFGVFRNSKNEIKIMIIPKNSNCNKIINSTQGIPSIKEKNINRLNNSCIYDLDKESIWKETDKPLNPNKFFYSDNPNILKNNKSYINYTSISEGLSFEGKENNYYRNCNLYDIDSDIAENPNFTNTSEILNSDNLSKYFGHKEHLNPESPKYLYMDENNKVMDGRQYLDTNIFYSICNHYSEDSTIIDNLNVFKNINKKFLYIITNEITNLDYSLKDKNDTTNISNFNYLSSNKLNNRMIIVDRINLEYIRNRIENQKNDIYISDLLYELFQLIYYYTNFNNYYFYFSDDDINIKNSINCCYNIDDYQILNENDFNKINSKIYKYDDKVNIINKVKYIQTENNITVNSIVLNTDTEESNYEENISIPDIIKNNYKILSNDIIYINSNIPSYMYYIENEEYNLNNLFTDYFDSIKRDILTKLKDINDQLILFDKNNNKDFYLLQCENNIIILFKINNLNDNIKKSFIINYKGTIIAEYNTEINLNITDNNSLTSKLVLEYNNDNIYGYLVNNVQNYINEDDFRNSFSKDIYLGSPIKENCDKLIYQLPNENNYYYYKYFNIDDLTNGMDNWLSNNVINSYNLLNINYYYDKFNKNLIKNDNIVIDSIVTPSLDILYNGRKYFEDYLLNNYFYTCFYKNDKNIKSLNKTIDENLGYSIFNNTVLENYIDCFIGSNIPKDLYYLVTKYGEAYANFDLSKSQDINFINFFSIKSFGYLSYDNFYPKKYVFLINDDESGNKPTSRQITILKNDSIVNVDIDDLTKPVVDYSFLNGNRDIISSYEPSLYNNGKKIILNSTAPNKIFMINFNSHNQKINAECYFTNSEDELNKIYFDYLNLLENKVNFNKINYQFKSDNEDDYKNLPNYKYYSINANNDLIIVRTVDYLTNNYVEIIGILHFPVNIMVSGDNNNIFVINKNFLKTKEGDYKIPFTFLAFEQIMNYIYYNLNEEIEDEFRVYVTFNLLNKFLIFKNELIEETSIIDSNKSEYYNLENQKIITETFIEPNYIKLYNIFDTSKYNIEPQYRIFLCFNGRIMVTNELINKSNSDIEIVDFYTINGRVNNIYIENVDVDNNNLICVASDRNELYIFNNLFKYNSQYCKYPYIKYLKNNLVKNCIKYIYNFNNNPLVTDKTDRINYYRETMTPTILNIGSSVDDITLCDKYLNTLNSEFDKNENIIKTNNIKYFKLLDDLVIDNNIKIDGNNQDDNNNFDDNNSYLKLESFLNNDNLIEDSIKYYAMINFRTMIDNREINENDRYYKFKYCLVDKENNEIENNNKEYSFKYNEKEYDLISNYIYFEMNKIYKNIYIYLPSKYLNQNSIIFNNSYSIFNLHFSLNNEYDSYDKLKNYIDDSIKPKYNCENVYSLPLKVKYTISDNYFPNEDITNYIEELPKKLTTRDYFTITLDSNPNSYSNHKIKRLYYRWRYLGELENTDTYDYYLFSFISKSLINDNPTPNDILFYISFILRNYLRNTFDGTFAYNENDFTINKIDFENEFKWNYINLPIDCDKCKLINIIIRKKKDNSTSDYWFDEVLIEDNINYIVNINTSTIKNIDIPYEKLNIKLEDYIKFLEYMENSVIINKPNEYKYNIEYIYQPSTQWINKNNDINLIMTKDLLNYNLNRSGTTKDFFENNLINKASIKLLLATSHDYYFQQKESEVKNLIKTLNYNDNDVEELNKYYNSKYDSNIVKDFIKFKYGYDNYEDFNKFIWSLILDEEDILNFKLNNNDNSFSINDTNNNYYWWLNDEDKSTLKWWENKEYRNKWIKENYMPLNNTLYNNFVNIYIKNTFNNGMNYNSNSDTLGLLNLTENISSFMNYGIEKRLLPHVYFDGLKLFNEAYYYKDNLNNSLSIFINPANLKSYIVNTKEFPYYDRFIKEIGSQIYYYSYNKDEKYDLRVDLENILSNIEVNTNFGLVSEQEKLVAYIKIKENETSTNTLNQTVENNITRTVKALNSLGGYYINSLSNNSNSDLVIDYTKIKNPAETIFTDQLNLIFTDDYIKNIINNNDRINVYISYKDDIGGKYARRINPKFYKISFEDQNVKLEIKGFYTYENISTIYIVTGDINNHNLFFNNIDKEIEYVDLAEIKTNSNLQLFKYLSYDNILNAQNLEINMNGYILYPNIDYTVINSNISADSNNLIMFRNKIPATKNISFEINLRPDNDSKIIYKTNQAFSMGRDKYKDSANDSLKKLPIAKTITLDNDKYSFMYLDISNSKFINKFDLYIDNQKVPNRLINVVNTKTISIDKYHSDKPIDYHKTHIAELKNNKYEITTTYDSTKKYRYFDPEYKNIMIVFQNKYSPYNYEIEIENKYQKDNFASLLQNLFFRFTKLVENEEINLVRTDSCYVPNNSTNIYDNFDWICESNGGKINNINENTKINILNNINGIIDCNDNSLDFNIILDSKYFENNSLNDNITFNCNPSFKGINYIDNKDKSSFKF